MSFIKKWAALGGDALSHPQALGKIAQALGGVPGDRLGVYVWVQGVRIGEQVLQDVKVCRLGEGVEVERVDALARVGEVGVDLEAIRVADDQQRRVFKIFAVVEKLLVGFLEVFVFAFVLPAEVAAHPDVGPAVAPFGLGDAALEGVPLAVGIGVGGLGLVEQVAEIEEVLLAGAPLGEVHPLPLGDELLRSHARSVERRQTQRGLRTILLYGGWLFNSGRAVGCAAERAAERCRRAAVRCEAASGLPTSLTTLGKRLVRWGRHSCLPYPPRCAGQTGMSAPPR